MENFAISSNELSLPYCEYLNTDEPKMLLTGEIGGNGIDCELFARTLMTLDQLAPVRGYKRICVLINSEGGEVETGMSIYDAMLSVKIPVDTYVTGRAASMGGVLLQAGRKRYMAEYAQMMLHNPSGTSNQEQLDKCKESLVKMLSRHGEISQKKIDEMMTRETWLMAEECLKLGLCDEVVKIEKLNNHTDSKILWKKLETVTNKINTNQMNKAVALALGLSENATETEINNAASKLGMRVENGVLTVNKKKNKKKAEDEDEDEDEDKTSNAILDAINALNKRMDKYDEDSKKRAKNEFEEKVNNKITALVEAGKIENNEATIEKVRTDLNEGFEVAARLYDAMPAKLSVKATKVTDLIDTAAKEHNKNKEVIKNEVTVIEFVHEKNIAGTTKNVDGRTIFTPATPEGVKPKSIAQIKAELNNK